MIDPEDDGKGLVFFAYATNYLFDTENAVILDVGDSRAIWQAEVRVSRTMIDRASERFGPNIDLAAEKHLWISVERCLAGQGAPDGLA